MSATPADYARVLVRDLEAFRREIELLPADADLWRTLPGVTNSVGALAQHAVGNLKHLVGGVLGGTGYVRDRDAEFARRDATRAALAAELAETIAVVQHTLGRLAPAVLASPYPLAVGGVQLSTGLFLLHLTAHLAFHLGQAGYLRRALTGSTTTSNAMSIPALAG